MKRTSILAALLAACGGEPTLDAGTDAPSPPDATAEPCAADSQCNDSLFCTVHRCLPGDPRGDARGCVVASSPCAAGTTCDEASSSCIPDVCGPDPDRDGDGHESVACGGNDCDDDDADRYGGHLERCDGAHDEDCDDGTVAGTSDGDADGDGATSNACCNGTRCGEDCDDADRAVFPGARELCNGRDDDCDGVTDDEEATPLCPGGVCTAGRCDLAAWDRTFGGTDSDSSFDVAMDAAGNVYVAAMVNGAVDFGGGVDPGLGDRDAALVAYGPDGTYRWHRRFGSVGSDAASSVAVDPVTGDVYLAGGITADTDLGGGVRTGPAGFLVALDSDGGYRWDLPLPAAELPSVAAHDGAVTVGGWFETAFDFGGDRRGLGGADRRGFVARYQADGTYEWDRIMGGAAGTSVYASVSVHDAQGTLVIGAFQGGSVDFGTGPRTPTSATDLFAIEFDAAGTAQWLFTQGGAGTSDNVNAQAAARLAGGEVVVGGNFGGTVDFGGGPETSSRLGSSFLVQLSSAGTYLRHRSWGGNGRDSVFGVAGTSTGDVIAVGAFSETVNFGGGARTAAANSDAFVVTFTSTFAHRSDVAFGATGTNEATAIAVGPANSTAIGGVFFERIDLGSGLRTAAGQADGFVVRLAR